MHFGDAAVYIFRRKMYSEIPMRISCVWGFGYAVSAAPAGAETAAALPSLRFPAGCRLLLRDRHKKQAVPLEKD